MKKLRKNWPNKIYLQIEDDSGNKLKTEDIHERAEITWSCGRINKSDIVYYRRRKAVKNEKT